METEIEDEGFSFVTELEADPPFWDYDSMMTYLKNCVDQNADNVIILEGEEGSGKSTAAITLSLHLSPFMRGPHFNPVDHAIYHYEDWLRVYDSGMRNCLYLIDEGGNLAFSRDHSKSENKQVVKILQQCRILNATLLFCVPNARWLDPYLREHRAKIKIRVHAVHTVNGIIRGFASVYWRGYTLDEEHNYVPRWVRVFIWKFQALDEEHPVWVSYEENKIFKLNEQNLEAAEEWQAKKAKTKRSRDKVLNP